MEVFRAGVMADRVLLQTPHGVVTRRVKDPFAYVRRNKLPAYYLTKENLLETIEKFTNNGDTTYFPTFNYIAEADDFYEVLYNGNYGDSRRVTTSPYNVYAIQDAVSRYALIDLLEERYIKLSSAYQHPDYWGFWSSALQGYLLMNGHHRTWVAQVTGRKSVSFDAYFDSEVDKYVGAKVTNRILPSSVLRLDIKTNQE